LDLDISPFPIVGTVEKHHDAKPSQVHHGSRNR